MLRLKHYSFNLPFQYPFTTAHGTKTHQPTLIVSLGLGPNTGYGEAPAITYYNVSVDGMVATLEKSRNVIERYALIDPLRFWHFLHHLIPGENFLIAALDIAGWDLHARMRRKPLWQMLGLEWNQTPITDYTIGLDTAATMANKLKAHPWPVYKVKLATPNDIDKLIALRALTDAPFRIDANEGWDLDTAKKLLPQLQQLGVTMVEQPLPRHQWEEMTELKALSPIPLFADEASQEEKDVARCAQAFHGINIKLTKCGGITPAMRMIKEARTLNLNIIVGSMNESTIGAAAVAHLLPAIDMVDMDGPLLLSEDLATGLTFNQGNVLFNNTLPGLSITPIPEKFPK